MLTFRIISKEQLNYYYDPAKSCNGGGYDQPCYKCEICWNTKVLMTVEIKDRSCGDFGSRIYVEMFDTDGNQIAKANYGNMPSTDEQYSDLDINEAADRMIVDLIADEIGYYIPFQQDIEEENNYYKEE